MRMWLATPVALVALIAALAASPVAAASAGTHWSIVAEPQPTHFVAGVSDAYVLIVRNDGATASGPGEAISVLDTLPSEATVGAVHAQGEAADHREPEYEMDCSSSANTATCSYADELGQAPILPGAVLVITVPFSFSSGTPLGANTASVLVDGMAVASTSEVMTVSSTPAPFGLSLFDLESVQESGLAQAQAGSHPYEVNVTLAFTVAALETPSQANGNRESPLASAAPKDLEVQLPPGLIGNPSAVPRCSEQAFLEREGPSCPLDTQVGTIRPSFYGLFNTAVFPVYNVAPPAGAPGELGFSIGAGHVPLLLSVRGNGEYGLTASLTDIPEVGPLQGAILTLWGVPASGSHDLERQGTRGEGGGVSEICEPVLSVGEDGEEKTQACPSGAAETPFLTLPTSCQGNLPVKAFYDSWEQPMSPLEKFPGEPLAPLAIEGCERLAFSPSLALTPETPQAGAPSGYTLDVHVPQDENPKGLATPSLRSATLELPEGVVLSPSVANGLQACASGQFQLDSTAPAACPHQSQIGAVAVTTPLLRSPLEGQIFLGQPDCSPCTAADAGDGKLLRLLVQAQAGGIDVKLEGSVAIEQASGRLTASIQESPELPFEDVRLTFAGGANAPLANAGTCATPMAASAWLTPYSGQAPAQEQSAPFTLSGCPAPRFQPAFTAGTTNNQAGAFSPLTLTLARSDEDEDLQALSVRLPPGLLGMLASVSACPQALAQAGSCPAQSEIGSASVTAGPGVNPLALAGSVYLTGPYEGAPYGLSIEVPGIAGPLNLGQLVIGARISVDPSTTALTITTDPWPQSADGIPLQLKTVNLDIDRAGFIRNPTDCRALEIGGTATSSAGASAALSTRFQAANCATLPFKPKLSALTHAHASKASGVHLHVRVLAGPGQAGIAKLALVLPRRMVPRLSTLQKACPAAVFAVAPSHCGPASIVGTATILTPVLRDPLSGPVYVLSRGHAAAPEVALALRSEGVLIEVIGQTRVHDGFESASFNAVPDVPFSELDVIFEAGPHSLLAADLPAAEHGDMCPGRLSMPTQITAQNGAVVKQSTIIEVSGCARKQRATRRGGRRQ
jgi:hypothetical protein